MAAPLLEAAPAVTEQLFARIDALNDNAFLARLPALRDAFDVLSPAARQRFLDGLREIDPELGYPPLLLGRWAAADRAGLDAAAALDPDALELGRSVSLDRQDRWRLILGRERERLSLPAQRVSQALDELYGDGRGEGSVSDLGGSERGGPTPREWTDELAAIFGARAREQIIGRAAARGRADALFELDPDDVTPSIELLQQVLALKGGLSEERLHHARQLVDRVVTELVKELALRIQPALAGSVVSRPTHRRGRRLDLRRTVADNLRTVRFRTDGAPQLVPDRLVFHSRARRSLDWQVILLVDVSGSMEASVIYSALMAAILGGLPSVRTHFVAFSTHVVDLSHKVDDPLGLLLEVSVGGGTQIARALRYARQLIDVPARSLVVLVTDFEEGGPLPALLAEVRALAESGARPLGLAALDDLGAPRFARAVAEEVVDAGMPVAAVTPLELARWIGEQLR